MRSFPFFGFGVVAFFGVPIGFASSAMLRRRASIRLTTVVGANDTEFTASIARMQEETDTDRVMDPWGGSYYIEALTIELARKAWAHILECEEQGGMTKAIEAGLPKMRIADAAARTQALIDSGRQTIVGLNKYQPAKNDPINVLKIDNTAVLTSQIKRLKELRAQRDQRPRSRPRSAFALATRDFLGARRRGRRRGVRRGGRRRRHDRLRRGGWVQRAGIDGGNAQAAFVGTVVAGVPEESGSAAEAVDRQAAACRTGRIADEVGEQAAMNLFAAAQRVHRRRIERGEAAADCGEGRGGDGRPVLVVRRTTVYSTG